MIKKILTISIVLLVLMFINTSYISQVSAMSFKDVVDEANNWLSIGENQFNASAVNISNITGTVKPIAQALTTVGVGVLLCVAAYMGIKWLTANPEEQAKLKQQSIGLLVAAVVVLGAYTIWSIALKIVSNF